MVTALSPGFSATFPGIENSLRCPPPCLYWLYLCGASGLLNLLKRHAMPNRAQLAASLVLAYAIPEDTLRPFLAPTLELDTYRGIGFLAIAMVETRNLRPSFLPASCGMDFFLAGYMDFHSTRKSQSQCKSGERP